MTIRVTSSVTPGTELFAGVAVLVTSMVALAGVQYLMPPSFDNPPGVNHAGIIQFQTEMHLPRAAALTDAGFTWGLRSLLALTWIAYGMILRGAYRHSQALKPHGPLVIGCLAVFVALLFPPSLSSDVYAYAGWGRMLVLHGWNPYVRTLRSLGEIGDPAGLIAPVAATTTHGPIWIAIVSGVVALLGGAGLWTQVVALKLLAAAALVGAALGGRAAARVYDARNAELALLAIGFNPLFLIEGPGSGHNDVLMVALMLGGIALYLKGRSHLGYFLIGLSVGIKFVTAAIVPWLIIRQLTRQPSANRFRTAVLALGLAFVPTLLAYAAFHVRTNALDGIKAVYEHQTDAIQETPSTTDASRSRPTPGPSGRAPRTLQRAAVLMLLYGVLTVVVWRFDAAGLDLSCWAIFSMTLILIGTPVPFPWYMVWPLSGSLIRWDRIGVKVNLACAALALMLLVQYTVLYVRR
jgi:hypothetical protein